LVNDKTLAFAEAEARAAIASTLPANHASALRCEALRAASWRERGPRTSRYGFSPAT
jgi:hypothetical protein